MDQLLWDKDRIFIPCPMIVGTFVYKFYTQNRSTIKQVVFLFFYKGVNISTIILEGKYSQKIYR